MFLRLFVPVLVLAMAMSCSVGESERGNESLAPDSIFLSAFLKESGGWVDEGTVALTTTKSNSKIQKHGYSPRTTTSTDQYGRFSYELQPGTTEATFTVYDADGNELGTVSYGFRANGSIDPAYGTDGKTVTGAGLSSGIPYATSEAPDANVFQGPYSDLSAVSDAGQLQILQVIHQGVFEPFWKNVSQKNYRVGVSTDTPHMDTMNGSEGGTVKHIIISHNAFAGSGAPWVGIGDSSIFEEKMHLFIFENYATDGIVVTGTYGVIAGYRNTSDNPAGYVLETDAAAWANIATDSPPVFMTILGDYDTAWADGSVFGHLNEFGIVDKYAAIKTMLAPLGETATEARNRLTITGAVSTTVDVSIDFVNKWDYRDANGGSKPERDALHRKDEVRITYDFAAGTGVGAGSQTITEVMPQKYFRNSYDQAMFDLLQLRGTSQYLPSETFTANGAVSGTITLQADYAEKEDGTWNVIERYIFDNYSKGENISIDGEYSISYVMTTRTGPIVAGGNYTGLLRVRGYHEGTVRLYINIVDIGGGQYNIMRTAYWDDNSDLLIQSTTILIPVSIQL
jgi:hypothetical protein